MPASLKITLFCGIKEVQFFPTAEMNRHFLTPKPLTVIEGDGYTPTENWISMLHYYTKTAGVRSIESVCRLIDLAMDEMVARALHAGSLGNLSIALVISITGNARHCSSTDRRHLQGICITIFFLRESTWGQLSSRSPQSQNRVQAPSMTSSSRLKIPF